MMIQSHDNNRLNILRCDFQLWTKKFYYHIHIAHFITRDFAHHEFTQDKIDCRFIDGITVTQRLQPCPHLIYRMEITLQDFLLQWLRHLTIIDFLRTSANQASSFALGLASVILIFLILVIICNYSIPQLALRHHSSINKFELKVFVRFPKLWTQFLYHFLSCSFSRQYY